MKIILPPELLMGMNDSMSILHGINESNKDLSIGQLLSDTAKKRKWSPINPALLLSCSYMYFVYGQEKNILNGFPQKENEGKFKNKFIYEGNIPLKKNKNGKVTETEIEGLKRHLRNSIAHAKYSIEINTDNGIISKNSDVYYHFEDYDLDKNEKDLDKKNGEKKYYFEFKISFVDFGNLIEEAGKYAYYKLTNNSSV